MEDFNQLVGKYLNFTKKYIEEKTSKKIDNFTVTSYRMLYNWGLEVRHYPDLEFIKSFLKGDYLLFDKIIDKLLEMYKTENKATKEQIAKEIKSLEYVDNKGNASIFLNNFALYFAKGYVDHYKYLEEEARKRHGNRYFLDFDKVIRPFPFYYALWNGLAKEANQVIIGFGINRKKLLDHCCKPSSFYHTKEANEIAKKVYGHLREQGFTKHDIYA